ncbi:hypothetical protein HHK36_024323 [Tetracentron sinense]|uniref:Aminotransferase-like plant mobile domain-containing protein n=1 Tax=Tetracentron sinense TaxID=13715 RepID=A0A834YIS1_TETSI|nr:hypothetical protein HHK36_024323 [Tetracentron sinense]
MDARLDFLALDEPEFPFVIRRLLLYIFGQCLFLEDRSSVDERYLQWMDPLEEIDAYDWGSTIYAIILRGLQRVTRLRRHSCRFFSPILEVGSTDIGRKAVEAFRTEIPFYRLWISELEDKNRQLRSIMASCFVCHGASSTVPLTDLDANFPGPSSMSFPAHVQDVVDFDTSSGTLITQLAKAWKERKIWNAYDDKCEEPLVTKEYTLWVQQLVEEVPSVPSCKRRKFQQLVTISYINFIAKERVRHENLLQIAQKEIAELKEQNAFQLGKNAFLNDRTGTSASLSGEDATSKAEIVNLMEETVSLRAKVVELQGSLIGYDISHLAWMDEAMELRKQVSTFWSASMSISDFVQAPVGSQEVVFLSMNADLAHLQETLRNLGHVSFEEFD